MSVQTPQNSTVPTYSEADLISMYEDLLATPATAQEQEHTLQVTESPQELDYANVRGVIEALYAHEDPVVIPPDARSQYMAAITKLREIVEALESTRTESNALPIHVSLLSEEEWLSLVRLCVEEQDGHGAETVIELIQVCLHPYGSARTY